MRRLLADGGPALPVLTIGDVEADMFDDLSADFGLHRQKVVELVATEVDELLSPAPADGGLVGGRGGVDGGLVGAGMSGLLARPGRRAGPDAVILVLAGLCAAIDNSDR